MALVEKAHKHIVTLLLEKSTHIEPKNKQGHTPLFLPSKAGGGSIVINLLLEKAAHITANKQYGQGSLSLTSQMGHG